jgi:hypothetical protein
LVETLRFLVIEFAVAKVEGAAWFGEGNFFATTFTDDMNLLVVLVVDDFVEAAVLADASKFF